MNDLSYEEQQLKTDKDEIIAILKQLISNHEALAPYIKRIKEADTISKADNIRRDAIRKLLK